MGSHVIVGAGPIGTGLAAVLRDQGEQVALVSRRGTAVPGVRAVAADAGDRTRMAELARGAEVVYNCANPAYHRWPTDWPPIADALLAAASSAGAVLVTMSNLYGYGPVSGPMTEDTPLRPSSVKARVRVSMWQQALAAHTAGRVRVSEARASDYLGRGGASLFGSYVLPGVLRGKRVALPCDPDAPHSFTYIGDAVALLVRLGADSRAWGRAWHVPSNPPTTIRALARSAARMAGAAEPRLAALPGPVVRGMGLFSRDLREFAKVRYQFMAPFVLDSSLAQATFGLAPKSLDEVLREML